jgi:hypothetical protein
MPVCNDGDIFIVSLMIGGLIEQMNLNDLHKAFGMSRHVRIVSPATGPGQCERSKEGHIGASFYMVEFFPNWEGKVLSTPLQSPHEREAEINKQMEEETGDNNISPTQTVYNCTPHEVVFTRDGEADLVLPFSEKNVLRAKEQTGPVQASIEGVAVFGRSSYEFDFPPHMPCKDGDVYITSMILGNVIEQTPTFRLQEVFKTNRVRFVSPATGPGECEMSKTGTPLKSFHMKEYPLNWGSRAPQSAPI